MRKINILLPLVSITTLTPLTALAIPTTSCSCSKTTEDIDISNVELYQYGIVRDGYEQEEITLTYSGFVLKDGNIDSLTVNVKNIKYFGEGTITAKVIPGNTSSTFNVEVTFNGELLLYTYPSFSLEFKDPSNSKWSGKTIDDFWGLFTESPLYVQGLHYTGYDIRTTKDSNSYIYNEDLTINFISTSIPVYDSFSIEFSPITETSVTITPKFLPLPYDGEKYVFYLQLDVSNITKNENIVGVFTIKNSKLPDWKQEQYASITIKHNFEDCFEFAEDSSTHELTLKSITCTDNDLVIPNEVDGKKVTAIDIDYDSEDYIRSAKSIFIPKNIINIAKTSILRFNTAFTLIETINVDPENTKYASQSSENDKWNCVVEKESNKLCISANKVNIPNTVETIERYAFYKRVNLTDIVLPDSITEIGETAFMHCCSLKQIQLPNQIKTLSEDLFSSCYSLETINIPNSVEAIEGGCFYNCKSLKSFDFKNVISIGHNSFGYCESLESINLPSSVTELSRNSFYCCTGLKKISSLGSITEIPEECFYVCSSLQEVILPEGIKTIGPSAFVDCESLEAVNIPASTDSIIFNCFGGCKNLKSIKVAEGNPKYTSRDSSGKERNCIFNLDWTTLCLAIQTTDKISDLPNTINTIGSFAYSQAHWLEEVQLPDNIKTIDPAAFFSCNSLTDIKLNKVETINIGAFEQCSSLTNIELPNVTQLGKEAFQDCTLLQKITLNTGITSIPDYCFSECSLLSDINISQLTSLTSIGVDAFRSCYCLKSIQLPNSVEKIYNYAFNECTSLESIDLSNTQIKELCSGCFYSCTYLKNVKLPSCCTKLCGNAFEDCESLTSIDLSYVKTIGSESFSDCYSLTSITLSNELESIDSNAFKLCYSLSSISLPDSLKTIGDEAFSFCTSFTSINIPENVKQIGNDAFAYCTSLTSATFAKTSGWTNAYGEDIPEATLQDQTKAAEFLREGTKIIRTE